MKIIKNIIIAILVFASFVMSACANSGNAISVAFSDITSPGSKDITFAVKYQEEKMYEDKGTDILVKADEDNVSFRIKKELGEFIDIVLLQKDRFYSLTKLMQGENYEYTIYKDAVAKNYIINSNQDFVLTLKAVAGQESEYKTMLLNSFDISKEYKLNVKKYEK